MRYKNAKALARDLEDELLALRLSKRYPSSAITGMPSGGSGGKDLSGYVAAVDELEGKIQNNRYQLIKTYTEISDVICALEDETQQRIMRLRYLQCMSWDEIAFKTGYATSWIYKLHGWALQYINYNKKEDSKR